VLQCAAAIQERVDARGHRGKGAERRAFIGNKTRRGEMLLPSGYMRTLTKEQLKTTDEEEKYNT